MSHRLAVLLFLACVLGSTRTAAAQPAGETSEMLAASELRIGAITGLDHPGGPPSLGGAIRFRPWDGLRRLSIYAGGDYRRLGATVSFDDALNSPFRLVRSAFDLTGSLGVDLFSNRRASLDLRAGAAFFRQATGFQIASGHGFVDDDNEWEGVCGFSGFSSRCSSDYEMTGAISAGVRVLVRPNGSFYLGADYTRLTNGANLAMFVIGARAN